MGADLSSSLAEALGVSLGGSSVARDDRPTPAPQAAAIPSSLRSLSLPDEEEDESIGQLAAARRAREDRDLASPSALIRRATRDWPEQCARVAALAVALGIQQGEAWRRVIVHGIEGLSEIEGESPCGSPSQPTGASG